MIVLLLILLAGLLAASYLLGFRLGGDHWREEVLRVRTESAAAQSRIHELTRQAFIAMAEAVQERRPGGTS